MCGGTREEVRGSKAKCVAYLNNLHGPDRSPYYHEPARAGGRVPMGITTSRRAREQYPRALTCLAFKMMLIFCTQTPTYDLEAYELNNGCDC